MKTSELKFNIIYTPGTVRYLTPFITTLLKWSDLQFRLIGNGCSTAENDLLQQVSNLDARLSLQILPNPCMQPHGETLDLLWKQNAAEYFCFMDSDILATGPFLQDFLPGLTTADCFSSCLPLWHGPHDAVIPPDFRHMHGIHAWTDRGQTIACDYFVVYRQERLAATIKATGAGLQVVGWQDIAAINQRVLESLGQRRADYDSGKLLTLLMLADGARIEYRDSDKLKHIGGFTEVGTRPGEMLFSRGRFDRMAAAAPSPLRNWLIAGADNWYARRTPMHDNGWHEHRALVSRVRRRTLTARYFYLLLVGLMDDRPLPKAPYLGDSAADARIRLATHDLQQLIRDVRSQPGPWQDRQR